MASKAAPGWYPLAGNQGGFSETKGAGNQGGLQKGGEGGGQGLRHLRASRGERSEVERGGMLSGRGIECEAVAALPADLSCNAMHAMPAASSRNAAKACVLWLLAGERAQQGGE